MYMVQLSCNIVEHTPRRGTNVVYHVWSVNYHDALEMVKGLPVFIKVVMLTLEDKLKSFCTHRVRVQAYTLDKVR